MQINFIVFFCADIFIFFKQGERNLQKTSFKVKKITHYSIFFFFFFKFGMLKGWFTTLGNITLCKI